MPEQEKKTKKQQEMLAARSIAYGGNAFHSLDSNGFGEEWKQCSVLELLEVLVVASTLAV